MTAKTPTKAELEILKVFWNRGPSTVREVFQSIGKKRAAGYTTVLKMIQIMTEKGFLERDASIRPQVFWAVRTEEQTQRQFLKDLVERVFGGSPGGLALQALSTGRATPEERKKIRDLLDKLEKEKP